MTDLLAALSPSDRTWPILAGMYTLPHGLRLVPYTAPVEEIFVEQAEDARFDIAEMSLASYLIARAQGDQRLTAIPVFLSRSFRHNAIYVRADSPLHTLADLRGTRFGMPEYQMTAAVWVRALLRDALGPSAAESSTGASEIAWVTYRPERVPVAAPVTRGQAPSLYEGLLTGEVDAIFSARRPPEALFPASGAGGKIRRLLDAPWEAERAYFREQGVFPIMHLVTLRRRVVERWPELPLALYSLFCTVRDDAVARLSETVALAAALPWAVESSEASTALFGKDLWPYGVEKNRHTLELFQRYLVADGLLPTSLPLSEVFASATLAS